MGRWLTLAVWNLVWILSIHIKSMCGHMYLYLRAREGGGDRDQSSSTVRG